MKEAFKRYIPRSEWEALKAEWRYWRHQALREFITPADWHAVRLPDRLFWLFPLVRPIGWLVRRRRG